MNAVQPSKYFEIEKCSHHFVLKKMSPSGQQIAEKFARNYIQYGMIKVGRYFKRGPVKVFAAKVTRKNEIRFHIGQWEAWKGYLADIGVPEVCYSEITYGFIKPAPLNAVLKEGWTAHDYQIPIVEYLQSLTPAPRKLVEIQPGKGKTFCASAAMALFGHRIIAFLKPKYLEKWVADLKAILDIDPEDIEVIQGSTSLMELIRKAREGELTCKAIIVSNRTFQNFITAYEEKGDKVLDLGYDCLPNEFIQLLECGVKLVDEVHEDFHLNFKIDLYTHVEWSISLSATLISNDAFISKMHEIAYPKRFRYSGLAYDKYVDSYALLYNIVNPDRIRSTEMGSNNYSHMAYEKNFFRNERLLKAYLDLINYRFEVQFLTRYEGDQRCLIYAASIQMCTLITEYLKKTHPDLDVRRYVEDDPYINLMQAQVCVSTIGSAGTGHDIPKLITVLLTVAIASKASNIQGFGRLRNLPDVDKVFEYFTCKDVDKHMEYYNNKEMLLAGMAKSITILELPYVVGE